MNTRKINGVLFEQMVRNGLHSLQAIEKELNSMNVFPVADGDTGTNMVTTLSNAISCARQNENLSEYLKALSSGMLLGARGNSGVILSQIFKGISLELTRKSVANHVELRNAFIRGYRVAYESVIHPVEGTILTVAREGIDRTSRELRSIRDIESLLTCYLDHMEKTLQETPDMLPVLKEMGVLDSGGKGYIAIVRGMLDCLNGTVHEAKETAAVLPAGTAPTGVTDLSNFDENSVFEEGYCMEFILQLLRHPEYDQQFSQADFIRELSAKGESLVVVQSESRVKVHVHTRKPAEIISCAQRYGEFLTFKLENMQLQHNEYLQKQETQPQQAEEPAAAEPFIAQEPDEPDVPAIRMPFAVIAAVNGKGNKKIFNDLGCKYVIECGNTMNASASDFLDMIRTANAEQTVILPGNGNLILAARQAADLSKAKVTVIPTKTIPESYFALAMDIQDSEDIAQRIQQMNEGMKGIDTLLVTVSARSFRHQDLMIKAHEWVAIYRGEPVAASADPIEVIDRALEMTEGIEDKESCIFFRGARGNELLQEPIEEEIRKKYPLMDVTFMDGGQGVYDWMIGIF